MTQPNTDRQTLVLIARGFPRPQPRPRLCKDRILSVADPNAKVWIATVERAARHLLEGIGGTAALRHWLTPTDAVSVRMLFRFPMTSGRKASQAGREPGSPHTRTPDADNLGKLVLDCLVRSGLLGGDDSRVASLSVTKVWDEEDKAGVTVLLSRADTQADVPAFPAKASDGSALCGEIPQWLNPF